MEKLWDGDYVFLRDWARSHTTIKSFAYLDEHCTEYVKPEFWLPNSPDMNVSDFVAWGKVKARVYENNLTDIESFKDAIAKEWEAHPQVNIENAINSFKKRLYH